MVAGSKDTVVSGEVDSGPGHQGNQTGDEVQGFEDYMGRAIAIRCLQLIALLYRARSRLLSLLYWLDCRLAIDVVSVKPAGRQESASGQVLYGFFGVSYWTSF